ncbi:hypothetical protein ABIB80_007902 [Bradyrhizobium sp. i1.15.2]|uniref:DUF6946 family protein n=1 Tax=Bradyrhizobium sp. i1.15.2 TaxID=3156362 RepID=UPI003395699F
MATELLIAIPEHKVSLRDNGRESQTDVFALIKSNNRTIAVAVEGKVNESFGPTIKDWYVDPSARKQQRLAFLCDLIDVACPPPDDTSYFTAPPRQFSKPLASRPTTPHDHPFVLAKLQMV